MPLPFINKALEVLMEKRGRLGASGLFLIILLATALTHTFLQLTVIPTQGAGISGLAVNKLSGEGLRLSYDEMSPTSKAIIVGEWILMFLIVITMIVKRLNKKMNVKKDIEGINLEEKYKKSKNQTDIDILYEVLKDRKNLRLSSVSELFKINEDLAIEWGRVLEAGDLATIKYPRIGEARIVLKEEALTEKINGS